MSEDCPFCDSSVSIISGELTYVREDKYPVSPGHLLIVPYRHVSDYFQSTHEEKQNIIHLIDETKIFLEKKFKPAGYNIGINCGQTAGQTILHLHVHVIPRYLGDMDDPAGGVRGVIPDKQKY